MSIRQMYVPYNSHPRYALTEVYRSTNHYSVSESGSLRTSFLGDPHQSKSHWPVVPHTCRQTTAWAVSCLRTIQVSHLYVLISRSLTYISSPPLIFFILTFFLLIKLFKRMLDQYDRLRKRNAFLDQYKKEPIFQNDLSEFDESRYLNFPLSHYVNFLLMSSYTEQLLTNFYESTRRVKVQTIFHMVPRWMRRPIN